MELDQYPLVYLNQVTNSEEAFIYEKRQIIDKSLFSEVSSSSSHSSSMNLEKI